jgi:ABC-type Fe3+-hydroxamate transport system substrate-binding protein
MGAAMPRGPFVDASGVAVVPPDEPRRIVSLVPSLTELCFALGLGEVLAGCTIYCTQPPDGVAGKLRVGGEKNPRLELIRELGADLVLANIEENLREHVETLRGWGIAVYVVYPRTVAEGIALVRALGELTGARAPARALADRLDAALAAVRAARRGRPPARVFCPIWRRPYMTIGADTYVHDMLRECGGDNVFANRPERYPTVSLGEVAAARPDVILLPDEPYRFRAAHRADFAAYPEVPAVRAGRLPLVDGKLLSWYGPRIAEALDTLPALLAG